MKTLYFLSHVLSAPFFLVAWMFYGTSWLFNAVGGFIHDETTYRLWLRIRHK